MIIKLTHANLADRPVYFRRDAIMAWHYNGPTACVLVYTSQNNCIPVKETAEEINSLITNPQAGEQESKNG